MKINTLAILTGSAAMLVGCRTNKDILNDYEADLLAGRYEHATEEVTKKAEDEGVDKLLWHLQAGGADRLAQKNEDAIKQFDAAEDIFIKNDSQSVFSQGVDGTFAMLTNDRAFPFAGGGQDRIFTCLYKAIDYGTAGNIDAVRTELNRAAQHQENWVYERRKDIDAARERMQKDAADYEKKNKSKSENSDTTVKKAFADPTFSAQIKEKTGFDTTVDGNLETLSQKDYLNVYVQHVCGVFRWITDGSGHDYFKGLPELRPGNAMLARDAKEGNGKPSGQVWVYVEDGLGPCREEWRLDLPLVLIPYLNRYVMYAGMAIPYLRYRDAGAAEYSLAVGGAAQPMEILQDMDALFKVEHDVYMRAALAREITRVVVKVGAQVALGVTADAANDKYTQIALKASQVAAAAWAASVTQADLRSWTSLPKRVWACRVNRPADGKVTVKAAGADIAIITVPEGNSMVFVSKPAPMALPVIKTINFK